MSVTACPQCGSAFDPHTGFDGVSRCYVGRKWCSKRCKALAKAEDAEVRLGDAGAAGEVGRWLLDFLPEGRAVRWSDVNAAGAAVGYDADAIQQARRGLADVIAAGKLPDPASGDGEVWCLWLRHRTPGQHTLRTRSR